MQWTEKDGVRFLRATDLQGRVVFDGPITTEEDRQKLPKEVGERLWAMQQSGQIPELRFLLFSAEIGLICQQPVKKFRYQRQGFSGLTAPTYSQS